MATVATELAFKLRLFRETCEAYHREIRRFPFLRLELRQLAHQLPHLTLAQTLHHLDRVENLAAAALRAADSQDDSLHVTMSGSLESTQAISGDGEFSFAN